MIELIGAATGVSKSDLDEQLADRERHKFISYEMAWAQEYNNHQNKILPVVRMRSPRHQCTYAYSRTGSA